MSVTAGGITREILDQLNTEIAALSVSLKSTTTAAYRIVNPVAQPAEILRRSAIKALRTLAYLAAQGERLDALTKGLNVRRLPGETDESLRRNAPLIFTPGSTPVTEIDPDEESANREIDELEILSEEQIYDLMRTKFMGPLKGATTMPLILPRYLRMAGARMRLLFDFLAVIRDGFQPEEAYRIANTRHCFLFDALRVPGVRDAKLELAGYEKMALHVLIEDRPGIDARGRRRIYKESEILRQISSLTTDHLPPADTRALGPPEIEVRPANVKPVGVRGIVWGSAKREDIRSAISDWFHDNRAIGLPMDPTGLSDAVLDVAGVTNYTQALPNHQDLTPTRFEVLAMGAMDIEIQ
jgi:hypothetical protein